MKGKSRKFEKLLEIESQASDFQTQILEPTMMINKISHHVEEPSHQDNIPGFSHDKMISGQQCHDKKESS